MKSFRTVIILIIGIILTGCSAEHDLKDLSGTKLEFETSICYSKNNTASHISAVSSNPSIGAIIGGNLPPHSSIGVYVSSQPDLFIPYKPENCANLQWEQTTGGWEQTDNNGKYIPFYLTEKNPYLFTYYPYMNTAFPESASIPVAAGYTDYMFGYEDKSSQTTEKRIIMTHAMSILSFSFTNQGYRGVCDLEELTIRNIPREGVLNIITGNIGNTSNNDNICLASYEDTKAYNPALPDGTKGFYGSYNFRDRAIGLVDRNSNSYEKRIGMFHTMVFPDNNISDKTTLDIKIDGIIKSVVLSSVPNGQKWEAGKRYIYNIFLKEDGELFIKLNCIISEYEHLGDHTESFKKPKG